MTDRHSFEERYAQSLRRWRWIVFVVGCAVALGFELYEHEQIDAHFLREFVLYGLIVPSVTWGLLTRLANTMQRQIESRQALDLHRRLTERLEQHQDWDELIEFVTRFPECFLPVNHASLFTYDHPAARLRFVCEWTASGAASPVARYLADSPICQACLAVKSSRLRHTAMCEYALGAAGDGRSHEFCQPLIYDNLVVGVLRLRCQPGARLDAASVRFLETIAPEIALALALSIAHPRQIAAAQVDERRRISRELHDSLGQMISYLRFNLDRLANDERLFAMDDISHDLDRLCQMAGDAYDCIRSDLSILRSWQSVDVRRSIEHYAHAAAGETGLEIELKVEGDPVPLPPQVGYRVFNIVREGLNNVVAHARARRVRIELVWSATRLRVGLVDDGMGFETSASPGPGHFGLTMMRERAQALRGDLTIDSSPGRGTRLTCEIPIGSSQPLPLDVDPAVETRLVV